MKSCKHINTLVIDTCFIDSEVYDIEDCEHSIKDLYLLSVGHAELANWKANPKRFQGLVKALFRTSLKKNLEHLSIWNCQYEISSAKKLIELYGMGHLNLSQNDHIF